MNDPPASWSGKGEAEDQALIGRAVRREPQAWAEVYERFSGALLGFFVHQLGNRSTAEDMTADVFVEALRGADRFSGNLADLRSWLFRIGRNNLIDYFRQQRRTPATSLEVAQESDLSRAQPSVDPADATIANLDRQRVRDAIQGLSDDQREVILLRLSGGLSAPQIAQIVSKSPGAVKALQHRAMIALARTLHPGGNGNPGDAARGAGQDKL